MRTLKKTLALVLCLAMMVGLCAFGASAKDFTDAEEIEYAEEVGLLTGIGVIDGIPVGDEFKFDPTGILTREQACKIITTMLGYGEIAPKAAPFTDVAEDRWSSGYISVCAGLGIVAGVGDGTFNPAGKLTAEAWQKMLLCALGYDAEAEGLVGGTWELGVAKLVKKTELSEGITLSPLAEITREQACKLAYNALTVPEVEYNGNMHVSTGDGTNVDINNPAQPTGKYIASNFGLAVAAPGGTTDKKDFTGNSVKYGVIIENASNGGKAGKTVTTAAAGTFNIDTDADMLGHYVKFYVSDNKAATVYSIEDCSVVVRTNASFTNTATKHTKAFGAAAEYAANDGNEAVFTDGVAAIGGSAFVAGTTATANTTYIFKVLTAGVNAGKKQLVAELADANTTVYLSKVTKIVDTEGKETITFAGVNGGKALENGKKDATGKAVDKIDEYAGIAEGDVVIVTVLGTQYKVTKAETVTGKITAIDTDYETVTIDGTAYAKSTVCLCEAVQATGIIADGAVTGKMNLTQIMGLTSSELSKNSYTLYLDEAGHFITATIEEGTAEAPTIYFAVADFDKDDDTSYGATGKAYEQVIDLEGNISSILVGKNAASTPQPVAAGNKNDITENAFVVFTADTDHAGYAAAGVKKQGALPAGYGTTTVTVGGNLPINATVKTIPSAAGTLNLNDKVIYISTNGLNMDALKVNSVKTGTITTTLTAATYALYKTDANNNKIVVAILTTTAITDQTVDPAATLYIADNASTGTNANGKTYAAYNVETGEDVTITCASTATEPSAANTFYSYTVKDGVYTLTKLTSGNLVKNALIYKGKLDSSILANPTDNANADPYVVTADTTSATFVDARASYAVGGELSGMDAIVLADKDPDNAGKKIYFSALLDVTGKATFIGIYDYA